MNAWRRVIAHDCPCIVVEADFVPVRGFGSFALPADVRVDPPSHVYLYAGAPELWDLEGGLRGHAGSTVAYALAPRVATLLLEFATDVLASADPLRYSGWDSELGYWLKRRGVQSYLPYRQLGEHGGRPNPEHRRAGLRAHHRADVLAGPLAFLPAYAGNRLGRLIATRVRARIWGLLRLLSGRFLSRRNLARSSHPLRLLCVAIGRQLMSSEPRRRLRSSLSDERSQPHSEA
jgi:hypothetical protein